MMLGHVLSPRGRGGVVSRFSVLCFLILTARFSFIFVVETRYALSVETNVPPMQWVKARAPIQASNPKRCYA